MRRTLASVSGGLLIGSMAAVFSPAVANAQQVCGNHSEIAQHLSSKFGEVPHGIGLVSAEKIMEIFISPRDGSWTILVTHSEGPTCVVAAGEAWETIPARADDPEFPS